MREVLGAAQLLLQVGGSTGWCESWSRSVGGSGRTSFFTVYFNILMIKGASSGIQSV